MERSSGPDAELDKWARKGAYSLVMGLGAFFAHFNSVHEWVKTPDYPRLSDFWFKPLLPHLEPYLPFLVIALGIGFLASACYCYFRYSSIAKAGGSAA